MVTNPKETLISLCSYLEIDYLDEMLNFQDLSKEMINHVKENKSNQVFEKVKRMHSNLENEVNATRVKAYEKEIEPGRNFYT